MNDQKILTGDILPPSSKRITDLSPDSSVEEVIRADVLICNEALTRAYESLTPHASPKDQAALISVILTTLKMRRELMLLPAKFEAVSAGGKDLMKSPLRGLA